MSDELHVLDLFCGGGGLSQGFLDAGYSVVAGVDAMDDYLDTYDANHDDAQAVQLDLHEASPATVFDAIDRNPSDIDVVVGGPPCKGFSIAGERDPDDDRNNLVDRYLDVVSHARPDAFVMENVPGILSMEDGAVVDHVERRVEEMGYDLNYETLNAADYGVPQTRRRVIFIGVREAADISHPGFPSPTHGPDGETDRVTVEEAFDGVDWEEVPNHEFTNHQQDTVDRIAEVDHGDSLYDSYRDSWRRLYPDRPAHTIKENHNAPFIHPHEDRVGTVRECATLQSFPDDYEFAGAKSTQLKVVGNAVPPGLASSVATHLRRTLLDTADNE